MMLSLLSVYLWRGLAEKNKATALAAIDEAITTGQYVKAARLLDVPLHVAPNNTDLLERKAQLFSHIDPIKAATAWSSLWAKDPDHQGYGVALVLNQIKAGALSDATKTLADWPGDQRDTAAYHRAGLAVGFATGNDVEALKHAQQLAALNPDSEQDRFTVAQLMSSDPEGQEMLWRFVENKTWRADALRLLAREYGKEKKTTELKRVIELARAPWADHEPSALLWALEAELLSGESTTRSEVNRVWTLCKENPQGPAFQQLLDWLNQTKQSALIFDLLAEVPVTGIWQYPTGFAMVEAALIAGHEEQARSELLTTDWTTQFALHEFCLARLLNTSLLGAFWLSKSVDSAVEQKCLPALLKTARAWGWLDGELALTRAALDQGLKIDRAELSPLMNELDVSGRTDDLFALSVRLHQCYPNNPYLLNNVAYYGLLLNQEEAYQWAITANSQKPENATIKATLALAQVMRNQWDEAASTLSALPNADETILPRILLLRQLKEPVPESLIAQSATLHLPQEKELLARALN